MLLNRTYGHDAPFTDLGEALAGGDGFPVQLAEGSLQAGAPFAFTLALAPPSGSAFHVVGTTRIDVPFKEFGARGRQLAWIHFKNPHTPYAPPAPWDRRFTRGYEGPLDGTRASLDRVFVDRVDLDEDELAHLEALYDGAVAFVDACVGRLVEALDAAGHAEDTLVVFTSDHGEDLYDHNHYFYHASSIYGSSTRVPLVVRQPSRVVAGQRARGLVELVDVLPTVLGWLGVDPAPDADARDVAPRGADLSAVLAGEGRVGKRAAFTVLTHDAPDGTESPPILSIRTPEWTYVWNGAGVRPAFPPMQGVYPIGTRELYRRTSDPDEQRDVLAEHPDVADDLHRRLMAWWSRLERTRLPSPLDPDALDEERRRTLEQLGYLAPAGDGGR